MLTTPFSDPHPPCNWSIFFLLVELLYRCLDWDYLGIKQMPKKSNQNAHYNVVTIWALLFDFWFLISYLNHKQIVNQQEFESRKILLPSHLFNRCFKCSTHGCIHRYINFQKSSRPSFYNFGHLYRFCLSFKTVPVDTPNCTHPTQISCICYVSYEKS